MIDVSLRRQPATVNFVFTNPDRENDKFGWWQGSEKI